MKKLTALLIILLWAAGSASAQTCVERLMPMFTGSQADRLCNHLDPDTFATGGDIVTDGNVDLNVTGKTLVLEDGTAASSCVGNVTATGTTAVTVSTTCAQTGDYVLISRSSAPSGTAQCWATNIVNGASFDLDCSGAETGTFHWWILKGQ